MIEGHRINQQRPMEDTIMLRINGVYFFHGTKVGTNLADATLELYQRILAARGVR